MLFLIVDSGVFVSLEIAFSTFSFSSISSTILLDLQSSHTAVSTIITCSPYFEKGVVTFILLFDMVAYNALNIFIFLNISLDLKYSSSKSSSLSAI